jgi:hypothetical protein
MRFSQLQAYVPFFMKKKEKQEKTGAPNEVKLNTCCVPKAAEWKLPK